MKIYITYKKYLKCLFELLDKKKNKMKKCKIYKLFWVQNLQKIIKIKT